MSTQPSPLQLELLKLSYNQLDGSLPPSWTNGQGFKALHTLELYPGNACMWGPGATGQLPATRFRVSGMYTHGGGELESCPLVPHSICPWLPAAASASPRPPRQPAARCTGHRRHVLLSQLQQKMLLCCAVLCHAALQLCCR